ncbi:MAG: hypothetical protein ACYTFT_03950, partial [Planctomycetota bacterium]
ESTEREGDRIFIYKWDYDFFSAHSARQHEDGTWWVHMHVFCYYRTGYNKEKGKWITSENHPLYKILEENIGK